jgi:hypothetical protein
MSVFSRVLASSAEIVDRRIGWHRLPTPLGLLALVGIRERLRERNLHDTGQRHDVPVPANGGPRLARTYDGTFTDSSDPLMGAAGTRFGRNVPLEYVHPEPPETLMQPNPRVVSSELLARDTFKPATILNVLAAAWIQFEVHDWVFHGADATAEPWTVECTDDDPWPERPMRIQRTLADPSYMDRGGAARTWVNMDTHWWDGSQVYGCSHAEASALRTGDHGKIRLDDVGLVPRELESMQDYTGQAGAVWLGFSLLQSLFIREHNAICDRLHGEYPGLSDDDLYNKARLVNAALMAKIHTLDWTTAILPHPTTVKALRTNWWGALGEDFVKRFGRLTRSPLIRGIPGSATRQFGVPYSLTEEFVAVYRLHPLIPDEYTFRAARDGNVLQERTFEELNVLHVRDRLSEMSMADAFYSFGIAHPGAVTLRNYPRFLREFRRPDGLLIDLAATDILRTRERGVPRYNAFRRFFHMKPASSFEELTDHPEWVDDLRRVYNDDIESVDLMVGLFAEPLPKGFGFSDTAFRVFVLMASRRLEADRFFTVDYRPEVYTQAGLDWVDQNTFKSMLIRHFPELEPRLRNVDNAFQPWHPLTG